MTKHAFFQLSILLLITLVFSLQTWKASSSPLDEDESLTSGWISSDTKNQVDGSNSGGHHIVRRDIHPKECEAKGKNTGPCDVPTDCCSNNCTAINGKKMCDKFCNVLGQLCTDERKCCDNLVCDSTKDPTKEYTWSKFTCHAVLGNP